MILSYKTDGSMLRVVTDNPFRSEFVYPVGRFSSLEELEAEISKSILVESSRKLSTEAKLSSLSSRLKAAGAVEVLAVDEVVQ